MGKRNRKRVLAALLTVAMAAGLVACSGGKNAAKTDVAVDGDPQIFVEQLSLPDDFIKGLDISSYLAEKESGVVYRDFAGNELSDEQFFALLSECGVNWIRLRVWNDPKDKEGKSYGGGHNDLETAKTIGKLASDAGLRVLIDFHYSDFWADPSKQKAPKEWSHFALDNKAQALHDFTLESLQALHDAGVDVGMVQVGNETNNGMAGESDWERLIPLYQNGTQAVRDFEKAVYGEDVTAGSKVRAAVHFTDIQNGGQPEMAAKLDEAAVDYDVFATSYYPYWHGSLDNLKTTLTEIASTYNKQVMVAEIAYPFTMAETDGQGNSISADNAATLTMDYNISVQGQADALVDTMKTLSQMKDAIGMFYWEPAWITVGNYDASAEDAADVLAKNQATWEEHGSGWASSFAASYDPNDAGVYYGGSSWDNQALFDAEGNPLDSLKVFRYVDTGATAEVRPDAAVPQSITMMAGEEASLPETTEVKNNDGSIVTESVVWDASNLDTKTAGYYAVEGKTESGLTATCSVEVTNNNLLSNGGFENGIEDSWTIDNNGSDPSIMKLDSKDILAGKNALKFDAWYETADGITVTQTVDGLSAGKYGCSMNVEGGAPAGSYEISIHAVADGVTYEKQYAELTGWMNWSVPTVENIEVSEGGSVQVVITITTTKPEVWGTIDDVTLYEMVE